MVEMWLFVKITLNTATIINKQHLMVHLSVTVSGRVVQ